LTSQPATDQVLSQDPARGAATEWRDPQVVVPERAGVELNGAATTSSAVEADDALWGTVALSPSRRPTPLRVRPSERPTARTRFIALESWEGVVTEVTEDTFVARLFTNDEREADEEAEILLGEISPSDLPLVEPGAAFYWSIGYRDRRGARRERVSDIRFRRLPAWTEKELAEAKEEALKTRKLLGL
jgi:hypothetical protein